MSSVKQRIDADLKIALLAGGKDRTTTLRGLKSVILNAEIASNSRDTGLDDDVMVQLLSKEVKKRIESAEMYAQGGSPERADKELQEKSIITAYMPAQLADEELELVVTAAIDELQASGMKDMGRVIALVKERVAGQADGSRIASVVKGRLQG